LQAHYLIIGFFSLLLSTVSYAEKTPLEWLTSMEQAHQQLNYKLPLIHLERNHVQSYAFEHGRVEGQEVAYIASLSGPVRHSYRIDNLVTYVEPEIKPYSIHASQIVGPSPMKFVGKLAQVTENYSITGLGKGRIAGRICQLIRLKSKDDHRFNYILWLDEASSLLLRYDLFDLENNLLEQIQAVGLHISENVSANLVKLKDSTRIDISPVVKAAPQRWDLSWTPPGYKMQSRDNHRLMVTAESVEYLLLSDGLSEISVYVAQAGELAMPKKAITRNGIAMANHRQGNVDITVVGRIPYQTALKLSRSVIEN